MPMKEGADEAPISLVALRSRNIHTKGSDAQRRHLQSTCDYFKMVLELHPCTESDIPEFVRIQIAAFGTGGGMTRFMVEHPPSEEYINKSVDKHLKSLREEKDITYLKVIDTELDGQMIAGAKWRINQKERREEEIRSMLPIPGADEDGKQAMIDFMWYLNRVRKEFMGTKPFYCKLHMITLV